MSQFIFSLANIGKLSDGRNPFILIIVSEAANEEIYEKGVLFCQEEVFFTFPGRVSFSKNTSLFPGGLCVQRKPLWNFPQNTSNFPGAKKVP